MTDDIALSIDWRHWMARWETQQDAYVSRREERFEVMLDVLGLTMPAEFTLVDLMCGPAPISARVLDRFPGARVIGVDLDPVLLAMGQGLLGDSAGRMRWIEANLKHEDWHAQLPVASVDAVLSTTAIHWLLPGEIIALYRSLARIIRPGGVFLNGDHMEFPELAPTLRRLAQQYRDDFTATDQAAGAETAEAWWLALREEPGLGELLAERERRFSWSRQERGTTFPVHEAALEDAGFHEVEVIWQHFDNRILMAVR